jgi:hypothetical protein
MGRSFYFGAAAQLYTGSQTFSDLINAVPTTYGLTAPLTYQIWRRFGSEGEFSFAGASGMKKYIDSTIPAGTQQVQYQIRGIRSTAAGEWAQFNVNFGQASGGMTTASVVETKVSPKLAA